MQKTITIALDMMSGDHGLESSVPAALKSLSKHQELNLILVGDKDKISKILKDSDIKKYSGRLKINHTDEFIRMDDEVLNAIRYKKKSSMRLSINLVKDTTAHACVSAGNTGALMALSKIILKTMDGIDRPAICTALPTKNDLMHMLDLGANIECSEKHLFQFAIMGGGEDYELCFTINKRYRDKLKKISHKFNIPLTRIGSITSGEINYYSKNSLMKLNITGFDHFCK